MATKRYAESANTPLTQKRYPTDCTDKEWQIIEPFTRKEPGSGRKRRVNLREVVNALFYRTRTGCQWRMLPKEFPNQKTVWYYYKKWTDDGTWERINDVLRRRIRKAAGRDEEPSLGILDSQTVKSTEMSGECGYDGAKHVFGRKRHIMVDILGLLVVVLVHAANIQDYDGAQDVLTKAQRKSRRLQKVLADTIYGYNGLVGWVKERFRFVLEIVKRDPAQKGFKVIKKRWIVERMFGWLGWNRILSKEYERLAETSESDIYIASIRLMLRRLDRIKTAA